MKNLKKTQRYLHLVLVFVLFANLTQGQNNSFLPKGYYQTFSDFILKKPTSNSSFIAYEIPTIPSFKIKTSNGKTERESFAFSDDGHIYIHLMDLKKHLINENWFVLDSRPSHYFKSTYIYESVVYFEINEISKSYEIIGIGIPKRRGVVFQKSISKFRILKTNKDVIDFLKQEKPELLEKINLTENSIVEIDLVRKIMSFF